MTKPTFSTGSRMPPGAQQRLTERAFGRVFAVVFAIVALLPAIQGESVRWWALALAFGFLSLAVLRPTLLGPLNRAWMALGRLLQSFMTPLIMGLLFFLTVTPTALLMRSLGKVPLRLRFDPGVKSYWIERSPPGPAPDTMNRQF